MSRTAYIIGGVVIVAAAAGAWWHLHNADGPRDGWTRYTHPSLGYRIDYPDSSETDVVEGGLNEIILGDIAGGSEHYAAIRILVFPIGSAGAPTREDFKYDGHPISLHGYDAWRSEGIGTSDRYFIVTVVIGSAYVYQIEMDEDVKGAFDGIYQEIVDSFFLQ